MIAEVLIYVPSVANFRVNWLRDRLEVAKTAALVLEAAPNGMVSDPLAKKILGIIGARAVAMKMGDTPLHAAAERRRAAGDRRRLRHAPCRHLRRRSSTPSRPCSMPQQRRDAGGRPRADGRRIYRSGDGRAAAAQSHAALFGRHSADLAADLRHHRGAGLFGAALSVRAADAARHRQHDGVPRRSGKHRPRHRAVGARRRDRHRRARAGRHADRACLDAASEEPAGGARARGVEDQSRSAQSACVGAAVLRPARQNARSRPCSALRRS